MSSSEIVEALDPVVAVLERLGVAYAIVGSVASSLHGIARATIDVDLVVDLPVRHLDALVAALAETYYIDRDAAADAIARRGMFNLVHLATMLKVDVYVLTGRPFDQASFARRTLARLDDVVPGREYNVGTAEDTILHKLEWFRAGGETSDRQWGDLVGVLKVHGDALDRDYLRRWSAVLGVHDLLDRALTEAA